MNGIGGLLRPRQEAVNLFPEALREGSKAAPLYAPCLAPKLGEAPWAIQGPAHKRANEAEKSRQRRNDVKTSSLNTEQLALAHLRYIVAGEIDLAPKKFGGLGASLTNFVTLLELAVIQDVEAASRLGRAQSAARSRLVRGRGSLQVVKEEVVRLNRARLH